MADDRVARGPFEDVSTVARPVEGPGAVQMLRRATVIEGPDAGTTFDIDPDAPTRTLVGTSPACQIRLTDPTVSRRHAALENMGTRFRIQDLGSTNGTFVDGVAIRDAYVRGGEVVRFGSSAVRLEAGAADPQPLPNAMRFGSMIGASVAMRRLYPLCARLAKTRVPVIIEGETGTGKEELAEAFHQVGSPGAPFVVFDCTTVASQLVEAELFGHERGAYTGAVQARAGVFEEASGGTLLIDEIGDLEISLQAKLLRAIDRGEVRRVGSTRPIKVETRVLAATRRDLDKEVAAGRFRDDLLHRLSVARIELPPLRERSGDIGLLARHFVTQMGGDLSALTSDVLARFEDYGWPGNVRELRNAIARLIALGSDELVGSMRTPKSIAPTAGPAGDWLERLVDDQVPFPVARRKAISEFERRYVERVLQAHDGNVAQAAKASGIALRYFRLVKARHK